MANDRITSGFLTRINSRAESVKGRVKHSDWVQRNTTFEGGPFGFKDHEMQVAIFDDPASRIDVKKCSQVGISEVLVRKLLTISAVERFVRVIYTLPTRQFAMRFSKDRIDTVISQSEALAGLVKKGADSVEQKVFTNSNVLYVTGTFGDTSAISVPATFVVNDEIDFSNQDVLGKMSSRLRHAKMNPDGHRGFHYKFSTPTLPGYGISAAFDAGDQKFYGCKCVKCNHWNFPNWYTDFVIPGYDDDIKELDKQTVRPLINRGLHKTAYLKCEKCGTNLKNALLDPTRRQWVAAHPERDRSGYQIMPWDVPAYNTPESILNQMLEYNRVMDFYNFVLGLDWADADAIFTDAPFTTFNDTLWVLPDSAATTPFLNMGWPVVAGCDVGKILHFTVGAVAPNDDLAVVYAEEITHTQARPGRERLQDLLLKFKVSCFVIDSGPDITMVRDMIAFCQDHGIAVYASEYVNKVGLEDFQENDDTNVVKVNRTETFTQLMRAHNTGRVHYPRQDAAPVMKTVKDQITSLKKISREMDNGELVEQFVRTGPDHFGHSLNYCNIAGRMATHGIGFKGVAILPGVKGVKLKGSGKTEDHTDPFAAYRR